MKKKPNYTQKEIKVGMCNCGHFEPDYERHTGCPDCGISFNIMPWKQAMLYLHVCLEESNRRLRLFQNKVEELESKKSND